MKWLGDWLGSLVVKILSFHCHGPDSVSGQETQTPKATRRSQKKKKDEVVWPSTWEMLENYGITAHLVGAYHERWWWTGRPGVLRFMGSQRVRHDWATELNWTELTMNVAPCQPPWDDRKRNHYCAGFKTHAPMCEAEVPRLWNSKAQTSNPDFVIGWLDLHEQIIQCIWTSLNYF